MNVVDPQQLEFARATLRDLHILPDAAPDHLRDWYAHALASRRGGVSPIDCQTIRDVLRLAGVDSAQADSLHVLLLALYTTHREGSICLSTEQTQLTATLGRLGFVPDAAMQDIAAAATNLASSLANQFPGLVSNGAADSRPLVYEADGHNLYFQRYFIHERSLRDRLQAMASSPRPDHGPAPAELRKLVNNCAQYKNHSLDTEQKRGLYLGLRLNFMILSGGPGTGKTMLVCSLLRALVRSGYSTDDIKLVAPTGRAGQRMGESICAEIAHAQGETTDILNALSQMTGSTVHRLLSYYPSQHAFKYNAQHRLPARVVIVDEVSMVDVVLMDLLLEALSPETKVVFIGDPFQLPSVEAGAVLADLVPRTNPRYSRAMVAELGEFAAGVDPTKGTQDLLLDRNVVLTNNYRFRGDLGLAANRINKGDASLATPAQGLPRVTLQIQTFDLGQIGGQPVQRNAHAAFWTNPDWKDTCQLVDATGHNIGVMQDIIFSWGFSFYTAPDPKLKEQQSYWELLPFDFDDEVLESSEAINADQGVRNRIDSLFRRMESAQILTLLRRGPYGCEGINRYLAQKWGPRFDPGYRRNSQAFAGAPIMVVRNRPDKRLFNGDVGIAVRSRQRGYYVVFRRGEEFLSYRYESIPEHELAFASTVHKAQGSQFGRVLVVMPPEPEHPLLTRQIVYTGVTRAKDCAIIYATPEVLAHAVTRRHERHGGLDFWK